MPAWDTTVVSRLYPGSELERALVDRARAGDPIAVTAPTVMEVVRGLARAASGRPSMQRALGWFVGIVASDLVEILPLDGAAAIVAGRLRAAHPVPPTGARRRATKTEQRAGWVLDMQIAACAWTNGRDIATENRRDFEALVDLLADLYPGVPPLVVVQAP